MPVVGFESEWEIDWVLSKVSVEVTDSRTAQELDEAYRTEWEVDIDRNAVASTEYGVDVEGLCIAGSRCNRWCNEWSSDYCE